MSTEVPVIGSYATPDLRAVRRVWSDVLSFIFGLWDCLGWSPVWQTGQQIGSNPIRSTIGSKEPEARVGLTTNDSGCHLPRNRRWRLQCMVLVMRRYVMDTVNIGC